MACPNQASQIGSAALPCERLVGSLIDSQDIVHCFVDWEDALMTIQQEKIRMFEKIFVIVIGCLVKIEMHDRGKIHSAVHVVYSCFQEIVSL